VLSSHDIVNPVNPGSNCLYSGNEPTRINMEVVPVA